LDKGVFVHSKIYYHGNEANIKIRLYPPFEYFIIADKCPMLIVYINTT